MAQQVDRAAMPPDTERSGIKGMRRFSHHYFLFSVFSGSGLVARFDFTVLNGSFGHVTGTRTTFALAPRRNGRGKMASFALELAPSVIATLGIIAITDGLGGLRAARR